MSRIKNANKKHQKKAALSDFSFKAGKSSFNRFTRPLK